MTKFPKVNRDETLARTVSAPLQEGDFDNAVNFLRSQLHEIEFALDDRDY